MILAQNIGRRNKVQRFPLTADAWAKAFGVGSVAIPQPDVGWGMQEANSPMASVFTANKNLIQNQALLYRQADTAAKRYSVEFDTTSINEWAGITADTAFGNLSPNQSFSCFWRFRQPDNAATLRAMFGKGASGVARWGVQVVANTGTIRAIIDDGVNSKAVDSAASYDDNLYHNGCVVYDEDNAETRLYIDGTVVNAAWSFNLTTTMRSVGISPALEFRVGAFAGNSPVAGMRISGMFWWLNHAITQSEFNRLRAVF